MQLVYSGLLLRRWVPDHLVVNDENVVIAQWTSTFGNHGLGTYSKVDWMVRTLLSFVTLRHSQSLTSSFNDRSPWPIRRATSSCSNSRASSTRQPQPLLVRLF